MATPQFAGDKKEGHSLLHHAEERLKAALLPCVPQGIETYHLTLTTVVWSILVVLFSWLATYHRQWLWGASLMVVAQYITDLLDGAIGRARNTGLIKWGFYMDHFLDYIFLCAILIGYSILMPNDLKVIMFFIMAVIGAFMVNSFLQFAATNQFRIAYWGIGPTEIRIGFILINTLIIYVNQSVYVQALPYILCVAVFGLFFTVYNTQRQLWQIDMAHKADAEGQSSAAPDIQGLVIRHFLLCFILASLAFWVLIAKIGGPFNRILAGVIYVTSWIPLLLAFQHKSWVHFKENPRVKRFGPIGVAAVILAVCAWIGINLMPMDRSLAFLLGPEGAVRITQDSDTVLQVQQHSRALMSASLDDDELSSWLHEQDQCRQLMEIYQAYNHIDFHEHPGLHTDAFLIGYAAMALHHSSVLTLAERLTPQQLQWLNQAHEDIGLAKDTFQHWKEDLLKPETLLKFGFNASYIKLLHDQIEGSDDTAAGQRRRALKEVAQQDTERYYQDIKDIPDVWRNLF